MKIISKQAESLHLGYRCKYLVAFEAVEAHSFGQSVAGDGGRLVVILRRLRLAALQPLAPALSSPLMAALVVLLLQDNPLFPDFIFISFFL